MLIFIYDKSNDAIYQIIGTISYSVSEAPNAYKTLYLDRLEFRAKWLNQNFENKTSRF